MNSLGALALVGSGEYLPVMQDLESALIQSGMKNGKANTFIQLPTAAGNESTDRLKHWEELGEAQARRIGAVQVYLPIYNRSDANNPDYAKRVHDAGLIYLSGGDPSYLADTLIGTLVWEAIVANWQSGSSLAGCSAGAMAFGSEVPNFFRMKEVGTPGLNIVPHVRTIPHYNKFFGWIPDSAAKLMLKAPEGTIIIGVDEDTALVTGLDSGTSLETKTWQVHGIASVHVLRGAPANKYQATDRITL